MARRVSSQRLRLGLDTLHSIEVGGPLCLRMQPGQCVSSPDTPQSSCATHCLCRRGGEVRRGAVANTGRPTERGGAGPTSSSVSCRGRQTLHGVPTQQPCLCGSCPGAAHTSWTWCASQRAAGSGHWSEGGGQRAEGCGQRSAVPSPGQVRNGPIRSDLPLVPSQ